MVVETLEKAYSNIAARLVEMAGERASVIGGLERKLSPLETFGSESFGYHRRREEEEWRTPVDNIVESGYVVCVRQAGEHRDDYLPRQTIAIVVQGQLDTEKGKVPFMRVTYRHASQDYKDVYWQVAYDVLQDGTIAMTEPTPDGTFEDQVALHESIMQWGNYESAFTEILNTLQREKEFDPWLGWDTIHGLVPRKPPED